jgi:dipeptidyl aminopeptidase/acylaminoacyl peptidase
MRSMERFDTQLPQLLDELSQPRTPDWFDDFVGLTARTRQRPAWTLPERWLPMVDIARQPVLAPRLPLRSLAIGFLIIALVLAAVVAVVASRRQTPAPPFGRAQTGLVAFERNGDIYVADPKNGTERAIVTGATYDMTPVWSLDGTRLAFERRAKVLTHTGSIVVVDADGSDPRIVTSEPLIGISSYAFSPDGQRILVTTGDGRTSLAYIATLDGAPPRLLKTDLIIGEPSWRPEGHEIAFVGSRGFQADGQDATGVYAMDVTTGRVRPIREHADGFYQSAPRWSPDGRQLAFNEWVDSSELTVDAYIVTGDGAPPRELPRPAGAKWQFLPRWSNDGTRLVGIRGYTGQDDDVRGAIVPVDGSGTGVEIVKQSGTSMCCDSPEFAPDDSFILALPTNTGGRVGQQLIVDPATGAVREAAWTTASYPAIQRLAK